MGTWHRGCGAVLSPSQSEQEGLSGREDDGGSERFPSAAAALALCIQQSVSVPLASRRRDLGS